MEGRELCSPLKCYKCHSSVFSLPVKFRPLGTWMHHIPACGRTASIPSRVRDPARLWPALRSSLMEGRGRSRGVRWARCDGSLVTAVALCGRGSRLHLEGCNSVLGWAGVCVPPPRMTAFLVLQK